MTQAGPADESQARIAATWKMESARIIAAVARLVRDLGLAEELAQDALVSALERWPTEGVPDKPGAWLMTTARHRALDHLRAEALHRRRQQELGADADARGDHLVPDFSDRLDDVDPFGDDLLRLIFTACHPVLRREAQVALTLKLLAGLSTAEIARAFVQSETTIAQRIVRARRTLAGARVPFEVPSGAELARRLAAVLEVIYLIFNEGYAATAGKDLTRPALCDEAQRLARVLAGLMPAEREVLGLLALLELQASRLPGRVDAGGRPILLADQDRGRWDRVLIGHGLAALARAAAQPGEPGPYELQAIIAAVHARATTFEATDWATIVSAYDRLLICLPSPVVALNRAMAVSMTAGPAAALPLVEALVAQGGLERYHLLSAVRADLLARLGRQEEARLAFERAAGLAGNDRERQWLLERLRRTDETDETDKTDKSG